MKKLAITGLAVGVLLAAGASAPAMAVDSGKSDLSVLHGVPGLTVDVYVNGVNTLDDSAPVLGPIDITLAADMSYTAVAHLDAAAAPTVSLFTNDISATAAGEGRLTVRHVAAAPAVDILADGSAVFTSLENPDEVMADLPSTRTRPPSPSQVPRTQRSAPPTSPSSKASTPSSTHGEALVTRIWRSQSRRSTPTRALRPECSPVPLRSLTATPCPSV